MSANYEDDARNVGPIDNYVETEEGLDQFYQALYAHRDKPTTLPDDYDFDSDDPAEIPREVDADQARRIAERWFKFAFGYAEYGKSQARINAIGPDADLTGQTVVFKLPGWFADDELGQWEGWWFGSFEVAKEDDDGEWTAMCLSGLEPMDDRNEDSYFRNPVEEEWVPFSLIDFAYVVSEERTEDDLICRRGLDSSEVMFMAGELDDAEIEFRYIDRTSGYGPKLVIDSPYEAKDDIKDLDWDQFHPDWNGDNWTIDAEPIWSAIQELTMQGWTVGVADAIVKQTTHDSLQQGDAPYLPSGAHDA